MSGCEATPEIKKIIRAMAKAKVEEGFTSASDILDEIHDAIKEHTPLWKNEIADIISGYGKPDRQGTKSELQQRILQLKRDLRETYHPKATPKTPDERRNATRQTQIKKQIEELQDRIARKDFSKPEKQPIAYDAQTRKLEADLASAKREADKLIAKLDYQNKSRAGKILDTILAFHRASILSGYTVLEHLTGAVLWRVIGTPLEQAAGALLHQIPGIRSISENAPTEGGGFQGGAQLAGLKEAFSKQTLMDMRDKILRGYSDLQSIGKAPLDSNHPLLEMVGHIHDALKTPAERFGYARALVTANKQARDALARDGMAPADIDRALIDPAMQARNEALAYGESQRAKLQGDNAVVDAVRGFIGSVGRMGVGGKAAATAMNYQMPILKIPTNLFAEATSYAAGGTKALGAILNAEKGKFTPEVNDYIMRNLKKGFVGKALAVVGWIAYQSFGAMYDEQRKKRSGEPDYGDVRTAIGTISHHWLHSPAWQFMQAVALAHRVYDAEMAKWAKKGQPGSPIEAAATAAIRGTKAMIEALPFVDAPAEFFKSIKDAHGVGDYAGKALSELTTPQIVKQVAKGTDPQELPRKPSGFVEQMEVGIPGLRENVPLKAVKGMSLDEKLDNYDKMTPQQRTQSGISDSILTTAHHLRGKLTDDQLKRVEAIE
jgi:hypothetical protein